MSGLFTMLTSTSRALDAQRAGLAVAGQNIANLNTEGYARRAIQLAEDRLGGVEILGIRARRDTLLDARVGHELPAEARERALAEGLSVIETSLGATGASIDGRLTAFFDAFSSLASDPTSVVARDAVVSEGQLLARAFAEMSGRLDTSAREADAGIRGAAGELNALAARVSSLNSAIATANGANVAGLVDERTLVLQQMAEIADVQVLHRPDGAADVAVGNGQPLVVGGRSFEIRVDNAPPDGFAQLTTNGFDLTHAIERGRIAGLVAVRDASVPAYREALDQLAYQVTEQVNALHQTGYGLGGTTGQAFFTPLGSPNGAASAMSVDAAVLADSTLVAAGATAAPADNQVARALADLRSARGMANQSTFSESWGQLVYRVGLDTATARAQQAARQSVVTQVEQLRDQVSGVSLDEEAGNMLKFQRAYEANARYFTAVDDLLDTLLNMARR